MRILSIGNFTTGWDGSICDEEHIAASLERMGHEVIRVQREDPLTPIVDDISFVLIAQWDGHHERMIDILKMDYSCPIVYWAFDYQTDGQEWHERLIRECDVYLSKPLSDARKHKNWRWLSQDFAPMFLKPHEPIKEDIDVLFTGSWVPWESGQERVKVLRAIDEQFNLHIYGVTPDQWKQEGFKNVHGPVIDRDLPDLIARAKVNFSMDHVWAPGYWSDRNSQIMACKGYVLFRHVPLSEAVFGAGVDYFHTTDECLDKIQKALDDSEYREMVARMGYDQATWLNRLRVDGRVHDLLTIMGEFL